MFKFSILIVLVLTMSCKSQLNNNNTDVPQCYLLKEIDELYKGNVEVTIDKQNEAIVSLLVPLSKPIHISEELFEEATTINYSNLLEQDRPWCGNYFFYAFSLQGQELPIVLSISPANIGYVYIDKNIKIHDCIWLLNYRYKTYEYKNLALYNKLVTIQSKRNNYRIYKNSPFGDKNWEEVNAPTPLNVEEEDKNWEEVNTPPLLNVEEDDGWD